MKRPLPAVILGCFVLCILAIAAQAQRQTMATGTNVVVPPLVNFSGVLTDVNGKPMTGVVGVTFLLYRDSQGGAPLWLETQNVRPDKNGRYTAMLGSASSHGLPPEIFAAGEAHWLGVQVSGQAEQPRVLLVSAPYALKAGDAETLGGFPASAFMLAAPVPAGAGISGAAAPQSSPLVANNVTGSGTAGYLPLWDSTSDITNSALFQTGSGTTAKVGINTATPTSALDVHGASTIRGTLSLPVVGNATAAAGKNSQPLSLAASAFNSTSSAAASQTFQWVAEPAANNTSAPSGTLNLLFGKGTTAPTETGLSIASNGQITFAAGQSFPITGTGGGTITGVTAGNDLTGGGTSGTVTLNLNTASTDTRYAQLAANNTYTGTQTIKNRAVLTTSSTTEALNVTQSGAGASGDGIHGISSATSGTGVFGEGAIGIQGLANPGTGLSGLFRGTMKVTGNGNDMLVGDPGCGSGYAGLGFASTALSGCTNYALLGGSAGGTYLNSSGTASIHFRSNNNELAYFDNSGNLNVIGQNGGGNLTVAGSLTVSGKTTGVGLKGQTNNIGIYGSSAGASATGKGRGQSGVWGDSGGAAGSGYAGVLGTADQNSAGIFVNNGTYTSLIARNLGNGNGLLASSSGTGYGMEATSPNVGVYGVSNASSTEGSNHGTAAGVWGDSNTGVGVLGTAVNNEAGAFYSKNTYSYAVLAENDALVDSKGVPTIIFIAQGGPQSDNIFCYIDTTASVNCVDGSDEVTVSSGARKVSLYAMQSTEHWFEDAGAGQLAHGAAVIELDPTYAQTVNTSMDYRVFLTPNGDCKGLYVSRKTATSFEVHELGGGTANIAFDYRIMAKRKGRENIRLKDVTDRMNTLNTVRRAEQLRRQSAEPRLSAAPLRLEAQPVAAKPN